ncbi:MAG: hypothetical protein P1P73_04780 [Brevefilum sp.]|nr:hypothetical protein [Brevefilum sp.]
MSAKRKVLIYGRSLSLAGISACLELDDDLEVKFVDPHDFRAKQYLDEFNPETILYDLNDPPNDLDLDLLQQRPGLLLIGVDPSSDEVLVLRGQRSRVVTAGELSQLISNHTDETRKQKGL